MRYYIDKGTHLVEFTFEQITQRIEWRSQRYIRREYGNSVILIPRW